MKIHHIAIWAYDLELLKDFYLRYFDISHRISCISRTEGLRLRL